MTKSWTATVVLAVASLGCQDGTSGAGSTPDTGAPPSDPGGPADTPVQDTAAPDTDAGGTPDVDPFYGAGSMVQILEMVSSQGTTGGIGAEFMDAERPSSEKLVATEGPCRYYQAAPNGFCDPGCGSSDYCGPDNACHPWPQRVSAGKIAIDGLTMPMTLTPDPSAWYALDGAAPSDLFAPGAAIHVTAAGAAVPAFTADVHGVADMTLTTGDTVALHAGQTTEVAWPVAKDGARVELVLQLGWHGAPPADIIWCDVDEADGHVTIPVAFADKFPKVPEIGLFQHPSMIRRVSRAFVNGPSGPIEVRVASERGVQVTK